MTDPLLARIKRSKLNLIEYSGHGSERCWMEALIKPKTKEDPCPDLLLSTVECRPRMIFDIISVKYPEAVEYPFSGLHKYTLNLTCNKKEIHCVNPINNLETKMRGMMFTNVYILEEDIAIPEGLLIYLLPMCADGGIKSIHYKRRN